MNGAVPGKKRLGDLLLEEGLIDKYQLQAALAEQKKWGGRLGKHLIDLGILSEETLVKVLSKLLALPSVDVGRISIPKSVIEYVPVRTAEKFNVMPIGVEETAGAKRTIIVAMADPTNLAALDELRFTTGCAVRAVVSGDSSIERAIRVYYHGEDAAGAGAPRPGVRRPSPSNPTGEVAAPGAAAPDGGEMVIMHKGEPVRFSSQGGPMGVMPSAPPIEVSSLPTGALTPVPAAAAASGDAAELARRLNALMRVLVRNKIMTEEEFLAELAKG